MTAQLTDHGWTPGDPIHNRAPMQPFLLIRPSTRAPCWCQRPDHLHPTAAMRWTPDQPALRFTKETR